MSPTSYQTALPRDKMGSGLRMGQECLSAQICQDFKSLHHWRAGCNPNPHEVVRATISPPTFTFQWACFICVERWILLG